VSSIKSNKTYEYQLWLNMYFIENLVSHVINVAEEKQLKLAFLGLTNN